jgi:hypothetical protein
MNVTDFDPLKLLEELQTSQLLLLQNQQLLEKQIKEQFQILENLNRMIVMVNNRVDLVISSQKNSDHK